MSIKEAISDYVGGPDRRKEEDLSVRRKLIEELGKSKRHIANIIDECMEKNDLQSIENAKKTRDEIELFLTEVDLSESGRNYPFFSLQKSIDSEQIKKLTEFDSTLITNAKNITSATKTIEDSILNKEEIDISWELKKVRQFITNARNNYKDRKDYIRRMK